MQEPTGGKVASLGQVLNRLFLVENWSFALKQKMSLASEQHILFWTNSAQMMPPYLPQAVALTNQTKLIETNKIMSGAILGDFTVCAKFLSIMFGTVYSLNANE